MPYIFTRQTSLRCHVLTALRPDGIRVRIPRPADVLRRLVNLLLPVACRNCGLSLTDDPIPFFCKQCWETLRALKDPACIRCGRPFQSSITLTHAPDHRCGPCRRQPPAFTRAWSLFAYEPPMRQATHLLKYQGKVQLASALGDLLTILPKDFPMVDLIIPVPLSVQRLRERGFNQALLLADRVGRKFSIPVSYWHLTRTRETAPQTTLSRGARIKNLRRAFQAQGVADLAGRRILLIDDVFTTGTTVNECAKALRRAGTGPVYVLTLSRSL